MGLISDISVVSASIATVISIFEWRRTLFAKKRADLAEEILAGFYEIKATLEHARNGSVFTNEGQTRPGREEDYDEERRHQKDNYYVPLERLYKKEERRSHLFSLQYRYQVLFDTDDLPFKLFNKIHLKLVLAVRRLARGVDNDYPGLTEDEKQIRKDEMNEDLTVIWSDWGEVCHKEDTIQPLIDEMINNVEDVCKPHIASSLPFWVPLWRYCKCTLKSLTEA